MYKKFSQNWSSKSLDFTEIGHGTYFMKFTAKSEVSHPDDNPCHPTVELHGLVSEDGVFYITEEKINYPPQPKEESE